MRRLRFPAIDIRGLASAKSVHCVEFPEVSPILPSSCANCGQDAGHTRREVGFGSSLLVPYCERCFGKVERVGTRQLAAVLASLALSIPVLLGLPHWCSRASLALYLLLVAGCAFLPLGIIWLVRERADDDQTAGGRAVWWVQRRMVACTSEAWAKELADQNDATIERQRRAEPMIPLRVGLVPLAAVVVTPALFAFQYPELTVLNLSPQRFELFIDGAPAFFVEPTSLESSTSGQRVRLGAGTHQVSLRDEANRTLMTETLSLTAGRVHLYAPMSAGYCFWLEQDVYGKAPPAAERVRGLPDETRFWTLPRDVDTWFAENPTPPSDDRSSGGVLVALRHARCAEAPDAARPPSNPP